MSRIYILIGLLFAGLGLLFELAANACTWCYEACSSVALAMYFRSLR